MTNKQIILEGTDMVENLTYHPVEKKYINVSVIKTILYYLLLLIVFFIIGYTFSETNHVVTLTGIAEVVIIIACLINLTILKKACAYKGYALRERDINYRKGIIFHKITSIPFSKIQEVSIAQGPVDRLFGLYSLSIVSGSQMGGLSIPGLKNEDAENLKEFLTKRIQHAEQ